MIKEETSYQAERKTSHNESSSYKTSVEDQNNVLQQEHTELDQERNQKSLEAKIIQQVEYYFSDENLQNDDFLVRQMAKHSEGYVRLNQIAKFKRMQKMKTEVGAISVALAKSSLLQLSPDGQMVRRLGPLPERVIFEKRTIVAGNLPKDTTKETLFRLFGQCGTLEEVEWPVMMTDENKKTEVVAYLRFQTEEQALLAIEKMNDTNNWRSGLRVRHKGQPPSLAPNKRWKTNSANLVVPTKSKVPNGKESKEMKEGKESKDRDESGAGNGANGANASGGTNEKKNSNRRRNKSKSVNSAPISSSPPSRQFAFGSSPPSRQSAFGSPPWQSTLGSSPPLSTSLRPFVSPPGLITVVGFIPIRQPFGPDGSKGFSGRGRPITN